MERDLRISVEEQRSPTTLLKWDVDEFDVRFRVDERSYVMDAKSADGVMGVAKGRAVDGDMRLTSGLDIVESLCEVLT